jgi:hypothetical protein
VVSALLGPACATGQEAGEATADDLGGDGPGDEGGNEAGAPDALPDREAGDAPLDDSGAPCDGVPHGETRSCGPEGVGECRPGTQECRDGVWAECSGAVYPSPEVCGNGLDEDCAGGPDDGCGCPIDDSGAITVDLDGERIFDWSGLARSLRCLGLAFVPDEFYGSGPPGASVEVVTHDPAAGLLEVDLVNFRNDHENCREKWGFLKLAGDCTDVWLEKWNGNPCSPYFTDRLKLETWIDTNDDCEYQGSENTEHYGGSVPSWDPDHRYRVVVRWE